MTEIKFKICCILVLSVLITAFYAQTVSAKPYLVKDGKAMAQIVIAEKPTRMQKLAANELRKYVKKISGAELAINTKPTDGLPIKIFVGKSKYTDELKLDNKDLDYGAYRIKSGKDWLAFFGKDTDHYEARPTGQNWLYEKGDYFNPQSVKDWKKKHPGPKPASHKLYNGAMDPWCIDQHGSLNAVNDFLRSLGVRWYMPGEFGEVCPKMASIALPDLDETVRPEWKQRDMLFWGCFPRQVKEEEMLWQLRLGLYKDIKVHGVHGTAELLQSDWIRKNHPEFFALYGGKRDTEQRRCKPCYSTQGLFNSAVGYSGLMFDYGIDVVSLTPPDAFLAICQCDPCKGKDTPERGVQGLMSDYVWDFMNRVAAEVTKTHPERKILCHAYNTYKDAPEKIAAFHPNIEVCIAQYRSGFHDPEEKKKILNLRESFLKKLPSGKIRLYEYYFSGGGWPQYYPRIIAEDLKTLKGHVNGTQMEVNRTNQYKELDPYLIVNHLNLWLTARLWWNPDAEELWWNKGRGVDALLDEYYEKFYGPAAKEMKAFIEFCEKNCPLMHSKPEPIDKAFELIAAAGKAAGKDNIYAKRVRHIADYLEPLKLIRDQLKVGREGNPSAAFAALDKADIKLDGKLDEPFWQNLETYQLKDNLSGKDVKNKTTFKVAWAGDSLYVGIRCEESDMKNLVIPAQKDGDMSIFDGDMVELLLETPTHAYYQITVDPRGHLNDLDRPKPSVLGPSKKYNTEWEAGIKAATYSGKDFWSIEMQVPALGENQEKILPNFGVSGNKPTKEKPWHFNIGRVRAGEKGREVSMFSPTGTTGFHHLSKFAGLVPKDKGK